MSPLGLRLLTGPDSRTVRTTADTTITGFEKRCYAHKLKVRASTQPLVCGRGLKSLLLVQNCFNYFELFFKIRLKLVFFTRYMQVKLISLEHFSRYFFLIFGVCRIFNF